MSTSTVRQPAVTRDQVLIAHAAEMLARTNVSRPEFADALSRALHDRVPEKAADKQVPNLQALTASNDTAAYLSAASKWLKRVERWLTGEIELPAWVEEAWVAALPAEHRERCVNELASRYGLVGARALGVDGCPVTAFGQLVARLGGTVEACGVVLADGRIDEQDLPHLPAMIESLLALESRACELRRVAENTLAANRAALRVVPLSA